MVWYGMVGGKYGFFWFERCWLGTRESWFLGRRGGGVVGGWMGDKGVALGFGFGFVGGGSRWKWDYSFLRMMSAG